MIPPQLASFTKPFHLSPKPPTPSLFPLPLLSFNSPFTTQFSLMTLFYYDFYVFAQLLLNIYKSNVCEVIYTPWLDFFWNKFGKF
jgi:hypothetical protein